MNKFFRHAKVPPDLFRGKKILDLGCGRNKLPGAVGLDRMPLAGVDVVADLDQRLPFDADSFDVVYANQVLEHVVNEVDLVYEIHRVLRPGGIFVAHCPYFRSSWAWIDPTHVRSFSISSMDYFVQATYCHDHYRFRDYSFRRIEVFLDTEYPSTFWRSLFSAMALRNPAQFENSFLSSFFVFQQITYILTK